MFLLGLSLSSLNVIGLLMAGFSALCFTLVMVFGIRLLQATHPMVLNLYVALTNTIFFSVAGVLDTDSERISVSSR